MEGGSLFNPGFLGAHFNWWIGQIPDDSYWRGNINPETFKSAKDIPGWGYRYKVRIIGLHDKEEETILSDQLPWAQVMYPITAGGGQGGSMQTPNIRQGMFVFGFFLDGADQQVPVIMGVLGNNTQTKLASTIGVNSSNYAGTSGVANRSGNDGKGTGKSVPEVSDSNLTRNQPPPKTKPTEEAAGKNVAPVASQRQDEKLKEKITLSSPCKKQNTNLKNIQIAIEELSKKLSQLTNALSQYAAAASSKVTDIQKQIEKLIAEAADIISKCLKGIFDQVKGFIQDQINLSLKPFENIAIPSFKLRILEGKISGFETLTCLFNKIGDDLLGLVKDILNRLFGSQISNIQDNSASSLIASPAFPFVEDAIQNPSTPQSNLPLTQRDEVATAATNAFNAGTSANANTPTGASTGETQQTYTPTPSCVVESLVGEVLAVNINQILRAVDAALVPNVANINNYSKTNGGDSQSLELSPVFLENNPIETVKNTTYDTLSGTGLTNLTSAVGSQAFVNDLGRAATALGGTPGNIDNITNSIRNVLGINPDLVLPAASLFSKGDIIGGFGSLAAAANIDPSIISSANSLLNGGDIVGGLSTMATSLGVPSNLVGSLAGSIRAIQQGQLPQEFTTAIDFQNLVPGINFDVTKAISFISSILGFFSCDQEPVCPVSDHYTLYNGGSTTPEPPLPTNVAKQTQEKLKEVNKQGG